MAVDLASNVFVSGDTSGSLGPTDLGFQDAFLRKYNGSGSPQWTYQFGSSSTDTASAVVIDGDGQLLVAGLTAAAIGGGSHSGKFDSYVQKLTDGATAPAPVWTHQYGTAEDDYVFDVATDMNNNVYLVGWTAGSLEGRDSLPDGPSDGYLRKLDAAGNHVWTRQFGLSGSGQALGVATDAAGRVIVVGFSDTAGYVRSYGSDGAMMWEKQPPGPISLGAVVTNFVSGDIYVGATASEKVGCQQYGRADGLVIKYNASGDRQWSHQFPNLSGIHDITIASGPVLYVSGVGIAPGSTSSDAYVHKIDASGAEPVTVWSHGVQTGDTIEFAYEVAADPTGDVLTSGWIKMLNNDQAFVARLAR